jgi:hypothetical protein
MVTELMIQIRHDMRRAPLTDRVRALACLVYMSFPKLGLTDDSAVFKYFLKTTGKHSSAASQLSTEVRKLRRKTARKSLV